MKVEIIDGPLKVEKPGKARYRIARSDGQTVKVRIVDADSAKFGDEFFDAFKANVRRARKDNRRVQAEG